MIDFSTTFKTVTRTDTVGRWQPVTAQSTPHAMRSPPVAGGAQQIVPFDYPFSTGAIYDQGQQGSCTAQAGAKAAEMLDLQLGLHREPLSRAFLYRTEQARQRQIGVDCGGSSEEIIASLRTLGACRESLMPYNDRDLSSQPSDAAFRDAASRRMPDISWRMLYSLEEVLAALQQYKPVIFGRLIGAETQQWNKGDAPITNVNLNRIEGGHELVIKPQIRLDNEGQIILRIINSWGANWGDNGEFEVRTDYVFGEGVSGLFAIERAA
jgi:hypothetical protein